MRNRRMLLGAVGLLLVPFAASGEGQTEAAAEEVTEITWMSPWTDAWTFQDMEERFGITVISNGINENDREKREVMLAAGEQPDIGGWWGNPPGSLRGGAHQGDTQSLDPGVRAQSRKDLRPVSAGLDRLRESRKRG